MKSDIIVSKSGSGADDAMVAWILGVGIEEARNLKWLVFVLAFDVLSLMFRLTGDMVSVGQNDHKLIANRLVVLLDSGLSVAEAGGILAHRSIPALSHDTDHHDTDHVDMHVNMDDVDVPDGMEAANRLMQRRYNENEMVKAGEVANCPFCESEFTKKTYNHRFCKQECRDDYWNTVKPERQVHKKKAA